jgi:hypothetical protein
LKDTFNFKHSVINPETSSPEEIKAEIKRLSLLMNLKKNDEQAIKIFINSIYGATASPYFVGYNVKIAEAITLQGQEVRAFGAKIFNRYLTEFWHRDKELHAKLGITKVAKVAKEPAVYGDTDSVLGSSLIRTDNGDITIEDLYNESCVSAGNTLNGHESVECEKNILNWTEKLGLHYSQPKRIIRHKVSKPKWRLRTASGKEIIVTNDHSMIVFRNGKKLEIKPSEIIKTDKILSVFDKNLMLKYQFEEIESCECIGSFDDEYVYDIEMSDEEEHTFIANDILVHNSVYVTFEDVVNGCDWDKDPRDLILQIYKHRLKEYIEKSYAIYATQTGTVNLQDLELETISYSAIFLKKKKYCLDLAWKDGAGSGITYEMQQKIKAVGVEIVQSSTPVFARNKLKDLLKIIFREKNNLNLRKFADLLKQEKSSFMLDTVENISSSSSISDYEKGIADDRTKLVINPHCPMHVRAAGYHNFLLNKSKWKNKYQLIKSGDKIKYYYAKTSIMIGDNGENVFGYLPGNYPVEMAPAIDYDLQFAKSIVDPINRFISAIGLPPISSELIVRTQLF